MNRLSSLAAFARYRVETWWSSIDPNQVLIALAIMLLVYLARRPAASLILRVVRMFFKSINMEMPENVANTILPASSTVVAAAGIMVGTKVLNLPASADLFLMRVCGTVMLLALYSATVALLDPIDQSDNATTLSPGGMEISWVAKVLKVVAGVIALSMIFKVWGYDISTLLAGVGVAGAAVAYILQDLLRSFVAGIASNRENRYVHGEWIKTETGIEGIVIRTGLRSTTIRQFDLGILQVPNDQLANVALINYSRRPHRRILWTVQVTLDTTTEQLAAVCQAIDHAIDKNPDFVLTATAPRQVRVEGFSESAIDIMVLCFTKTNVYGEFLKVREALAMEIKHILTENGVHLAYPSRTLYIEHDAIEPATLAPPRPGLVETSDTADRPANEVARR